MLHVLQQHISDLRKGKTQYRRSPFFRFVSMYEILLFFCACVCVLHAPTCTHMHIQLDVSSSMVYHIESTYNFSHWCRFQAALEATTK